MKKQKTEDATRLIPSAPPARLPEEELLTQLKANKAYRRNASLARSLLYHPQRLFTSGAPSRLLPPKTAKELRYRMIAVVTSFALLLGMVNFAPLDLFSLAKKASANVAETGAPNYDWLLSADGADGTAEKPYKIATAGQLHSLAVLVNTLRTSSDTLSVKIKQIDHTIGPGQSDNPAPAVNELPVLAPGNIPVESTETPSADPTEPPAVESTEPPATDPTEAPATDPTEPSATESTEPPATDPTEPPATESTEPPVTDPTEPPATEPTESLAPEVPVPALLRAPLSAVPNSPAPSQETEAPEPSAPDPEPSAPDPDPSASDPEPSTPDPEPSTPDPEPSTPDPEPSAPDPEPSTPDPEPSTPDPEPSAPDPEPSASDPVPTPTPELTPTPSASAPAKAPGNSGLFTVAAGPYTLKVPVGLAGWHFKLTADLGLEKYSASSPDGLILNYWLPIGVLDSVTSAGAVSGSPFLGIFDGGGHTISSFYYALNPDATTVGYGLFGYVGNTGTVKSLTVRTASIVAGGSTTPIPWSLSTLKKISGANIVDHIVPLGSKSFAVGVLAAASSGTVEGCTVAQAELSYSYTAATTPATVMVGGLVGVAQGGSFTDCTFLGKISNTLSDTKVDNATAKNNYSLQQVGGIAGSLYKGSMTRCAAGVALDIYNGGVMSLAGGVGGLFGYGTEVSGVEGCFTTGVVRACHDGGGLAGNAGVARVANTYSTVTLGKTAKTQSDVDVNLSTHPHETMGGLFGTTTAATAFEKVYFAASLLEPQFGALVGRLQAGGTFTDVAVDATQAPHRPFNSPATTPVGVTVARNLAGFLPLEPPVEPAPPANWVSAADSQPQLAWAANATNATTKALSAAATKQWITPTTANAYSGVTADNALDGEYNLYRMKTGSIGDSLGDLPLREALYQDSKGQPIGGIYTGSVTVDGVAVPAVRCAMSALNQTEGRANVVTSGSQLLGLADRVNLAGGGYLGGVFVIDGTVDASGSPLASYAGGKPFCGNLLGHNTAIITNLSLPKAGSVGLFDTAYTASFQSFTIDGVTLGTADGAVSMSTTYFGVIAGQVIGVTATGVAVNHIKYAYTADGDYGGKVGFGLLFGTGNTISSSFTNCSVDSVADSDSFLIANKALNKNIQVYIGGILGSATGDVSSTTGYESQTFQNCTVNANLTVSYSGAYLEGATAWDNANFIGGIFGHSNGSAKLTFTGCTVSGNLKGGNVGGIAGRTRVFTMADCTFVGNISSAEGISPAAVSVANSGGLVGMPQHHWGSGSITRCAVFGNISAISYAGGMLGYGGSPTAITDSYVSAIVSGNGTQGGLIGWLSKEAAANNAKYTNSYFVGQLAGTGQSGGIIGRVDGETPPAESKLSNVYYDKTLLPMGISTIGGMTGFAACGVDQNATAWDTLAAASIASWRYTDTTHYPQLTRMASTLLSDYSTVKLFRLGTATTVLEISPDWVIGNNFRSAKPNGVTATTNPLTAPFLADNSPADYILYTLNTGENTTMLGPIDIHFPGVMGGKAITLPYRAGLKFFTYGDGTAGNPYLIPDAATMDLFRKFVDAGLDTENTHFAVARPNNPNAYVSGEYTGGITIALADYAPTAVWPGMTGSFYGILKGCGSTVTGFSTSGSTVDSQWNAGLFHTLGSTSRVENLNITGAEITGPASVSGTGHACGILAARSGGGEVENVSVQGSIHVPRDVAVGGLIGSMVAAAPATLTKIVTDVTITGSTPNGANTTGAGQLVGEVSRGGVVTQSLTVTQCAAYGSIEDWGCVGGLIGSVNNTALKLDVKDCLSITKLAAVGASSSVYCGGLIGSITNIYANRTTGDGRYTVIDSSYYAGENDLTGTVGGIVGAAQATTGTANEQDYGNLTIKNTPHNTDSNTAVVANIYYKNYYNGRYDWPNVYIDPPALGNADPGRNYGTSYAGNGGGSGNSFTMTQGTPASSTSAMKNWDVTGTPGTSAPVWRFSDGLYPQLYFQTSDELTFPHLGIHYTLAASTGYYSNVFVRFEGTTLEVAPDGPLKVTKNNRMAVATAESDALATVTIRIGTATRQITMRPSLRSNGNTDVSIYYINREGMWDDPTQPGKHIWSVYTADALAGLNTIFSSATKDQRNIPTPPRGTLNGGEIQLARDIGLSESYHGMRGDFNTWQPIGSDAFPFNITFDGKGRTLYDLAMNPFKQTPNDALLHTYADRVSPMGLFGTIDGGTVKNLVLAGTESKAETTIYQRAGVRVAMGTTVAGTLAATVKSGTLENCQVSIPVYTMGNTPRAVTGTNSENWSAIEYLGMNASTPLGGLVGRVTGTALIKDCAYTGYVYGAAQSVRPDAIDVSAPERPVAGPVGGLVGEVTGTGTLTVENSYMAGLVDGGTVGTLVGTSAGAVKLTNVSYDSNATGLSMPALGAGTATGEAATQVPAEMGTGWVTAPAGLYPVQERLSTSTGALAARLRVTLTPHASSAVSGTLDDTSGGAALFYAEPLQPVVAAIPGQVSVTGNQFEKTVDGLTQLELRQDGYARRVLINVRCWYDDMTPETTPEGGEVRHYTISTAEELWELGQIVNGTIGSSADSKVGHTHALEGGHDDFKNAVIHFSGDVDLSTLMDVTESATTKRPWVPIGLVNSFAGTFLGGGHGVSGMAVTGTTVGLFGTVSGTVQDLLLTNASLTLSDGNAVGGLLCATLTAGGKLQGCGASGTAFSGSGGTLGGLVGQSHGSVSGCFSTAELTGTAKHLGGIAGSNSGSIGTSYFTGYANAINTTVVGGITGSNSGTASHCYVSAYLVGQTVHRIAENATNSVHDGRHTSAGGSGNRQDGEALAMGEGWTKSTGNYPIPNYLADAALLGTPLAQAAKLAATIFTFGGTVSPNYTRFASVSASSTEEAIHGLRSGNPTLLSVSGNEARPVTDTSGDVVLRLGLLNEDQTLGFLRPCWLTIPTTLAVAYRFNWSELITLSEEKPNEKYNQTNGSSAWSEGKKIIRTADDWNQFVAFANSNSTVGDTFTLDFDIDFGNQTIATVTRPFEGTFHGGNHTLKNFQSTAPLFAQVAQGSKVEFLAITNGTLAMSATGTLTAALLVGENWGRISNIAAEGCSVRANQSSAVALTSVGGLVGRNSGVLESSYFYVSASSGLFQVTASYPDGTTPTQHRMGGLVGYNSGTISGCYSAAALTISGVGKSPYNYCSALVGLNDGAILYTYWKSPFDLTGDVLLTSYRNGDGTFVSGQTLFMGNAPNELTARWLSADSYGGTYYYDGTHLKLFSFELVKYDLSAIFGSFEEQYLILGLQFGAGDNAMASNAICSWKDYLLPNFANLPLTAALSVRLPLLSSKLTYTLSKAYVIQRESLGPLASMGAATITLSTQGGYQVTGLGDNTTRVILDITLTPVAAGDTPWGVYRKDNTLPKESQQP